MKVPNRPPWGVETEYEGQVFRSQLEARVVATLNRQGTPWTYEEWSLTFRRHGSHCPTMESLTARCGCVPGEFEQYVPDFRISGGWVEVKPNARPESLDKAGHLAADRGGFGLPIYIARPRGDRLSVDRVVSPRKLLHAEWVRCPSCGNVQPATVGDSRLPCCGARTGFIEIVRPILPDLRNGSMVWTTNSRRPRITLGNPVSGSGKCESCGRIYASDGLCGCS